MPFLIFDITFYVVSISHEAKIFFVKFKGLCMKEIFVRVDNGPDITFFGELIGSAASSDNRACRRSFSGNTGRWTELFIYKTAGGNYVCSRVERTRWTG